MQRVIEAKSLLGFHTEERLQFRIYAWGTSGISNCVLQKGGFTPKTMLLDKKVPADWQLKW